MNKGYGPTIIRVIVGLFFLVMGTLKLLDPSMPAGMLSGLGFPAPMFFAWILLLSEIIFGLALLLGYMTKYVVWPLTIVLVVAVLTVVLPGFTMGSIANLFWHLLGIGALVSLYLTGPGELAIGQ